MTKIKRKKNKTQSKRIVLLGIVMIMITITYFFLLKNTPQKPSSKYLLYQDSKIGFSIKYPEAWELRQNTQIFENGDAIAFGITGQNQKTQTELTDGAQISISLPFKITTNLDSWIEKYFDDKAEISQNTLNNRTFKRVYTCSGAGCITYFYTAVDNQIYGIAVF